jgi:hypothetical protein
MHLLRIISSSNADEILLASICEQNLAISYKRGRFNPSFYHKIENIKDEELRYKILKMLIIDDIEALKFEYHHQYESC